MKHPFDHAKLFTTTPMCGGKRSYPSKRDAETVKFEQEILTTDLELSIYHCHMCGGWHLTRRKDEERESPLA